MSTLASKVAAIERHRRAVAREILRIQGFEGSHLWPIAWVQILRGQHRFDVHAAREHAKTLVDPLHGPLAELEAFADWTRAKGLGPENREPGAFGGWCPGELRVSPAGKREFWPCWEVPGCTHEHAVPGGWPGKLAREWPEDSRAPMGRSPARLGQRILDALEGQASECGCWVAMDGQRMKLGDDVEHTFVPLPCRDCHGTGHNLRGKLPGVEWSPAVVVAVADSQRNGTEPEGHTSWTRRLYDEHADLRRLVSELATPNEPPEAGHYRARVCPRGEHRADREPLTYPRYGGTVMRCQGDDDGHIDEPRAWSLLPAWRRGEIEHARQRRERARRRRWQLAEAPSVETTRGSDRFANVHRARFRVLGVAAFEYFRDCMDDRSPVDLTRISSGLPDGEWVVDGLSTEADTDAGLAWTEVSITRLIRVELPGRIESVRVEGTILIE